MVMFVLIVLIIFVYYLLLLIIHHQPALYPNVVINLLQLSF